MTTLGLHRIRLACKQDNTTQVVNVYTGDRPLIHRARGVQFELGMFFGATLLNIQDVATVTLEIKTSTAVTSAPLATKSVSAIDFNAALTQDQWDNYLSQHVLVEFESAETGFDMTAAVNNLLPLWLVISAVMTNGNRIPIVAGLINMLEDGGATSADIPVAGDPAYYTAAEVNALLNGQAKLINDAGATFTLRSPNGQYSRTLTVTDQDEFNFEKEFTP